MPIRYLGEEVQAIRWFGGDVTQLHYPLPGDTNVAAGGDSDAFGPALTEFTFADAEVTITIAADGTVTVSAVLASDMTTPVTVSTTADFSATSPVHVATNRDVLVSLTVPAGFSNTASILMMTFTVSQTVDPSDTCNIGNFVGNGTFNITSDNSVEINVNTGSCTAGVCVATCTATQTFTTRRTRTRTENAVRTVTRVTNGEPDLVNPCAGVSTTGTIPATNLVTDTPGSRSVTITNPNYGGAGNLDPVTTQGTPTGGVETVTNTSACTVTDTTVGCCPDATCSGAGTAIETYDVSAVTRVDTTVVRRRCDNTIVSSTDNTVTVTAAQTGLTRSVACTGTYTNPDTCGCNGAVTVVDLNPSGVCNAAATGLDPCRATFTSNTGRVLLTIVIPTAGDTTTADVASPTTFGSSLFGTSALPVDNGVVCAGTYATMSNPSIFPCACNGVSQGIAVPT